jgi:hypothetical protein
MPGRRNLMLRIEELRIAQDHQVTLTARLYADEQFPQSATARTIVLTGGAGWLAQSTWSGDKSQPEHSDSRNSAW